MLRLSEWSAEINIRGELVLDAPLADRTTFRTGGPADLLARPADEADLQTLITAAAARDIPVTILGGGSNILIADAGIRGLVVDMTGLAGVVQTDAGVRAGAGTPMTEVSAFAADHGLGGLDFIYAMPGSVGGAVWMNARCYGGEIVDVLESVRYVSMSRVAAAAPGIPPIRAYTPVAKDWGYKRSPFMSQPWIMTSISFRLPPGEPKMLWSQMHEHEDDRRSKGHFEHPCAGSIFKNNRTFGAPSGAIIDRLGLRGFTIGGAKVSDRHANIIQNTGSASSAEIRSVIEHVANAVQAELGMRLEREVLYVGDWGKE